MSLIGRTLHNHYKVLKELGHGSFGYTYLAQDLHLPDQRYVVVKHLQPENPGPEAQRLFYQEAQTLQRLGDEHNQIPRLYAYFKEGGEFYLVQEFVEGYDLSKKITSDRRWSESETIELLIGILEILQFIHRKNVIHRDIHPSNIMRRTADRKLVLIDFGAVKQITTLSTNSEEEKSTITIGHPGYMPSEQFSGHPQLSSDIYAVGMIGIQALTGLHPRGLPRNSDMKVIWRDGTKVSDSLAGVLNKMVEHDCKKRYQNASEALKALKKHSQNWFSRSIASLKSMRIPTVWLGLGLAAVAITIFIKITTRKHICSSPKDFISCGEEILDKNNPPWNKKQGVDLFSKGKYQEAVKYFQKSWEKSKVTETLIYLNNALLQAKKAKYYTIAVVVPILKNEDGTVKNTDLAKEILRGVAHAQTQINLGLFDGDELPENFPGKHLPSEQENKDFGLQVIIADDFNVEQESEKRAEVLSKEEDILGIVGSYTSDMTMASVDIYNGNELVLISSGTTTKDLTERPRDFFFRVLGNTDFEAESLVTYLIQMGQNKAAVFYNIQSPYASSLYDRFKTRFENKGGTIATTNDNLSQENFNPEDAIKRIRDDTAIVLLPDGQVTSSRDNALEITKVNQGGNWIATGSPIYSPKTLETGDAKLFEKVIIYTAWHRNSKETFSSDAQKLWQAPINARTALSYDATMTLMEAMARQEKPTREGTQQELKAPDFQVNGATGVIEFCPNKGDRQNPPATLVKVQKKSNNKGLEFVPVEDFNRDSLDLKDCP